MLRAAAEAAAQSEAKPMVLGVTVLTSLAQSDLEEVGIAGTVDAQVLRLADLAVQAGCGGIVAAAPEARQIRKSLGAGFAIVTPGVRPAGLEAGDQAKERVVTPGEAIRAGATHIVVGRPISESADPAGAAEAIVRELEADAR
jgi:orotidine-5'-phosphate decarboxylase